MRIVVSMAWCAQSAAGKMKNGLICRPAPCRLVAIRFLKTTTLPISLGTHWWVIQTTGDFSTSC